MYFKDIYKPIPTTYNLVMAMLWRHPEHVDLDQIKVVHYCAKVCFIFFKIIKCQYFLDYIYSYQSVIYFVINLIGFEALEIHWS